uniref:Uncharacterized protein n=1 Tax=Arundo donax TaxID=35708 RepID=A0A0A9ADQ9_ARUDO
MLIHQVRPYWVSLP